MGDDFNNRVVEFKPPFMDGMNASVVLGQATFTTGATALSQSGMDLPAGVALDASGNLWVGDSNNCRAIEFTPPFMNGMNASTVVGEPDFTTANCGTAQNMTNEVAGLALVP